ncbi:hypothetical protein EJB05_01013, partial [Eragrostis curvula]
MELPMQLLPLLLLAALVSPWQLAAAACQRKCGDVEIPYPFGIGHPDCYLDKSFELTCKRTSGGGGDLRRPTTVVDGFEVLHIDVLRGKMQVRSPVISRCVAKQSALAYESSAFRISGADNRLVVVGCNASAYVEMWDTEFDDNWYKVSCRAVCSNGTAQPLLQALGSGSCNGTDGCCQVPIPPRIMYFNMGFLDDDDGKSSSSCSQQAMLVEQTAFGLPSTYVTARELFGAGRLHHVSAVLDWTAGRQRCQEAEKNTTAYACNNANTECLDSDNGYLCQCSEGYRGNPYVRGGCQDVNECEEVEYLCPSLNICKNTPGGFKCHELRWLAAAGTPSIPVPAFPKFRFRTQQSTLIGFALTPLSWTGVSIVVVVLGVGMSCTYTIREKRRLAAIKKRYFKQHGGLLLFEEIKARQGHLSFKLFTKEELEEATNKFDERHVLGKGGNGTVYRGELKDGRTVAIKRCRVADDERQRREFGKEMLILSQVNHRNIVKLYGCCLEVEVPILVYQFIPNGTLYQLLHGDSAPSFAMRMKIAHEAAEALAYLHSTASPPIIHGDVKSPNILLDGDYAAKVSDFGASALAPTDEAHLVTLVQGTCGYLDPEYMQTCRLTDRSDVYSFGVVLLELLTRRKALSLAAPEEERSLAACFLAAARDGRLDSLVDAQIKDELNGEVLEMVATLAKRCLEMSGERRPSMREVAEEIDRVRKLMCKREACLGDVAYTSILVSDI